MVHFYVKLFPEQEVDPNLNVVNQTQLKLISPQSFEEREFSFTQIFSDQSNLEIFTAALPHLKQNNCFVAYGQAQSGKTHTLFDSEEGLFHYLIQHLLQNNETLSVSIIQLGERKIVDLLDLETYQQERRIRLNKSEYYVENLNEVSVQNVQQASLLCQGALKRATRLHTILTIKAQNSLVHLVELFLPQQLNHQDAFQLSPAITTLFNVLRALPKNQHIPYRDSKLTMLLKSIFNSASQIFVIGTIFPRCTIETLMTLQTLRGVYKEYQTSSAPQTQMAQSLGSQSQNKSPLSNNDLCQYLLKLIARINAHTCKLLKQDYIQQIDTSQPVDSIINQVQMISMQLIEAINKLANQGESKFGILSSHSQRSPPVSQIAIKQDSWVKAFQYLYNSYEEEIQREDQLMKQKLIYIINEEEQYDPEELKARLFPQKQEQLNSMVKTLSTLRKYTNTIDIPSKIEHELKPASQFIQSLYLKETNKQSSILKASKDNLTVKLQIKKFQNHISSLMNKYKGLQPILENDTMQFQSENE